MIIFFQDGRLGNQLSQYVGIMEEFKGHSIVLFGFESLSLVLDNINAYVVKKNIYKNKFIFLLLYQLFNILTYLRVISASFESFDDKDYSIVIKKGLFKHIIFLKNVYFQHQRYEKYACKHIHIRANIFDSIASILNDINTAAEGGDLVFVHVRRGDYIHWPTTENPAVLPFLWYKTMMDRVQAQNGNFFYIICSDDAPYVDDLFNNRSDVYISKNDELIDFLLMIYCKHGIMSASSFSWWAACISRLIYFQECPTKFYLAPKYWCGHKVLRWHPPFFKSSWISYYEV